MKYLKVIALSLMFSVAAYAQEYKKHTVAKGETITDIAKKYRITPYDIYRLNPDSKNGIKENTVLLIPGKPLPPETDKEQPTKVANTVHEVQPKETLYSLCKKYDVTPESIRKANPGLKDSLQVGQKLIIPAKGSGVAAQVKEVKQEKKSEQTYFYHTVEQGETKYGIAKKYGMSLQLLESLNPAVKDTLPLGYKLKLAKDTVIEKETASAETTVAATEYTTYVVHPKETFYSLTRRTGLTEAQITELNPQAKGGLKEGMELRLPKSVNTEVVAAFSGTVNLASSLNRSNPKELAILLPFNLSKLDADSTKTTTQRLRTDRFLNMTLDFYAGALMAIDSARALGLPLKVKILDSKETKTTSAIAGLKPGLSGVDAVIGPFFQNNVESTAALLGTIPVISPLSKDPGKAYANLFQSIPTTEMVKSAMLDYLKAKDANIIAVIDPKKGSSRQLIVKNLPEARILQGAATDASIRPLLSKDKMNYVILDSETVGLIVNTTKVLAAAQADYNIQLAALDPNPAYDNDEVPLARLTALKMMYPSVTNDDETPQGMLFSMLYRSQNGVLPTQFATRGFDVTFDTILRLFQTESFGETCMKSTEQVENKFEYTNINNGNYNTGVYIMQYGDGNIIKQAQ